jgi:hypothetical protein
MSGLVLVDVLAVTAPGFDVVPSVFLEELDEITDFQRCLRS